MRAQMHQHEQAHTKGDVCTVVLADNTQPHAHTRTRACTRVASKQLLISFQEKAGPQKKLQTATAAGHVIRA